MDQEMRDLENKIYPFRKLLYDIIEIDSFEDEKLRVAIYHHDYLNLINHRISALEKYLLFKETYNKILPSEIISYIGSILILM